MTSASMLAQELVRRLLACGVREAVVSPGSRSGPIARALAAADRLGLLRMHVRVDEREAAFLALGMAKLSGRLTPVVTTSGTAVANLHPALMEARHTGVPLMAITADRPGRLRGTGANQTTEQRHVFGDIRFIETVHQITAVGPVHLNLELDEPLSEPIDWDFAVVGGTDVDDVSPTPYEIPSGPRTVVVAGDGAGSQARAIADAGQWPLFAEPTSGARTGGALATYRLLLEHSPLAERIERVVSFGHATLSRSVVALLSRDVEVIHVGSQGTYPLPAGDNVRFVDAVRAAGPGDPSWLSDWREADGRAREAIAALADSRLQAASAVWAAVPPGGLLWVGSSNPIRDLDLVAEAFPVGERRKVVANRGLAGIDGTLSSAIGAALVRGPGLAYVGDLTFLHGSNGLLIGPGEPRPDLTIVVVNDDGGGIFAGLEQGGPEFSDAFERIFATPTGANIAALCEGYGVQYERREPSDLAPVLAAQPSGLRVVEVPIDRHDRRALGQRVSAAVRAAVL